MSVDEELTEFGDEPAGTADEFVTAATFFFADEAAVAFALLRSCDVVCYLANEHTLAKVWPWNITLGGLRLMVPASLLEQVQEILNEVPSEEDFMAQAGFNSQIDSTEATSSRVFNRGRKGARARTLLVIAILCSPAVDALRVLYVAP
ncbi:MAG TPA: hypothetical protein VK724_07215 [Bryobacteraceae bacterium]|jgi:hypothetical protein|nr:hypothetical protein [Bryobacteraceae bacterium]